MGDSDIVITSTTDSDADVMAAMTGTPAPAVPETPAAPDAAAPPAPPATPPATPPVPPPAADPAPAVPAVPETAEQATERERKSARERRHEKIQSEIDKDLERKRHARQDADAEEARLADLRRQRTELEAAGGGTPTPPAAPGPGQPAADPVLATLEAAAAQPKPKLEDVDGQGRPKFANYEEWMDAANEWYRVQNTLTAERTKRDVNVRLETAERERIDRDTATRAQQHVYALHLEHVETFKQRVPDFDAVLLAAKEDVDEIIADLGPNALNAIDRYTTEDAGVLGPAIIHHLATHPAEMRRIAELPIPLQLAALGKIEARLETASTTPPGPASVPPVNAAPEPITPVGSTPTASTVDPDKEDFRSYVARRNREERLLAGLSV
jgi:hypothetical protein